MGLLSLFLDGPFLKVRIGSSPAATGVPTRCHLNEALVKASQSVQIRD